MIEKYLKSQRRLEDVLQALGATLKQLDEISQNQMDQRPFPRPVDVKVGVSRIHGYGLFAMRTFDEGETICPARVKGRRTPAGRYSNHSGRPNALAWSNTEGDVFYIARQKILAGEEITTDYFFNFINSR